MKNLTQESTTIELRKARPCLAILPIGATEQHSHHLPLATDSLVAEAVARGAAARLGAWCMPALPYSISHMHRGTMGTAWLRNETLVRVIHDLAASVRHEGFRQFAMVNFHGGNQILPAVVQDLNLDFSDLDTVAVFSPWQAAADLFKSSDQLQHANEFEVSCLLHLAPHLVRRKEIRDQKQVFEAEALRYAPFPCLSRLTHTGTPSLGTAAKGKKAIELMVEHAARSIRESLRLAQRLRHGTR
jgi:creatinine amidohydrolase